MSKSTLDSSELTSQVRNKLEQSIHEILSAADSLREFVIDEPEAFRAHCQRVLEQVAVQKAVALLGLKPMIFDGAFELANEDFRYAIEPKRDGFLISRESKSMASLNDTVIILMTSDGRVEDFQQLMPVLHDILDEMLDVSGLMDKPEFIH